MKVYFWIDKSPICVKRGPYSTVRIIGDAIICDDKIIAVYNPTYKEWRLSDTRLCYDFIEVVP